MVVCAHCALPPGVPGDNKRYDEACRRSTRCYADVLACQQQAEVWQKHRRTAMTLLDMPWLASDHAMVTMCKCSACIDNIAHKLRGAP